MRNQGGLPGGSDVSAEMITCSARQTRKVEEGWKSIPGRGNSIYLGIEIGEATNFPRMAWESGFIWIFLLIPNTKGNL